MKSKKMVIGVISGSYKTYSDRYYKNLFWNLVDHTWKKGSYKAIIYKSH